MPVEFSAMSQNDGFRQLLHFSIPAESEAVGPVADAISETLSKRGVPEQKLLGISLAVQAALLNAVVHGCKGDRSKNVTCDVQCDEESRIVIVVRDPGPGFSPESISDPKKDEHLHADHGRGVYLIRQLMDEVQFERNGSEIRMWKF